LDRFLSSLSRIGFAAVDVVKDEGIHPVGRINLAIAVFLVLLTFVLAAREETRSVQAMSVKAEALDWIVYLPLVTILGAVTTIIVSVFIIRDKITQKNGTDAAGPTDIDQP
jgi:hypothetical protein